MKNDMEKIFGYMGWRYNGETATNPEQLLELIEKTNPYMEPAESGWWAAYIDDDAVGFEGWYCGDGNTLAEAVINAVLERIGSEG